MKNLNYVAEELFNKIRGRFQNVTIGDENGKVTNVPEEARFFDFSFIANGDDLGKVSVSLDEDNGVTIIVGRDLVQNQMEDVQDRWYNFLKELRMFAKKRTLQFDVRDINKSNLNKRDYNFLATNLPGENKMAESRMYGTKNTTFQRIGNARVAIKHSAPIGEGENRLKHISRIFIETPEGERIRYPVKHLQGARALALHVSEGGHPFDDFGKYITGLSEELASLGKFKKYMNRKSVMAEALQDYMGIVESRVKSVRTEIRNLQKSSYYTEAVANYTTPEVNEVPDEIAENWIDQLTIKQFNEELKDVFPYIYNLVGEATKAKSLGSEELMAEMDCWDGYKKDGTQAGTGKNKGKRVNKCVPEEIELEQGFEEMMGQFAEGEETDEAEEQVDEAYINTSKDAVEVLANLRKIGKSIERGQGEHEGNLANMYANDVWDVYSFIEARTNNFQDVDKNAKAAIDAMMDLRKEAKSMETKTGSGKNARFGNNIVTVLYPVMQYLETTNFDRNAKEGDDDTMDVKINSKGQLSKDDGTEEKEQKTPLGEFILSYFDRENGKFPKGETAILTAVQKDYGDEFVKPAAQFMEKIEAMIAQRNQAEASQSRYPETAMIKQLAGVN